jgi:hypothetical protein
MKQEETKKALIELKNYVIKQSKSNLTKLGKNSSKKLYNSIDGEVEAFRNSIQIIFTMNEYGFFQDKGVSGKDKKYNTPFSYKSKMPPPKAFDKWIVRKGIAPRDKNGKFISRKSLQFLIARSIFKKGIKPSLFFTKPFEKAIKRMPEEITAAYGLDASKLIDSIMKQNFSKNGK